LAGSGAEPELAARELARRIGISSRAVEKQIAKLRQEGRLRRAGPAKSGHGEVSYDLQRGRNPLTVESTKFFPKKPPFFKPGAVLVTRMAALQKSNIRNLLK